MSYLAAQDEREGQLAEQLKAIASNHAKELAVQDLFLEVSLDDGSDVALGAEMFDLVIDTLAEAGSDGKGAEVWERDSVSSYAPYLLPEISQKHEWYSLSGLKYELEHLYAYHTNHFELVIEDAARLLGVPVSLAREN